MERLTEKPKTIAHFCAACDAIKEHSFRVDHNQEYVLECQGEGCDRFLKYPLHHIFEEPENAL